MEANRGEKSVWHISLHSLCWQKLEKATPRSLVKRLGACETHLKNTSIHAPRKPRTTLPRIGCSVGTTDCPQQTTQPGFFSPRKTREAKPQNLASSSHEKHTKIASVAQQPGISITVPPTPPNPSCWLHLTATYCNRRP